MPSATDNLVLSSDDSPARVLWIETLFEMLTPPAEQMPDQVNEDVTRQLAIARAHCEVACELFGTQYSPLTVFSEWDELSFFVHLSELRRIHDFVSEIDTSEFTEEDQRAHNEAMEIMEDVIDFAENVPAEEEEEEQDYWEDGYA